MKNIINKFFLSFIKDRYTKCRIDKFYILWYEEKKYDSYYVHILYNIFVY